MVPALFLSYARMSSSLRLLAFFWCLLVIAPAEAKTMGDGLRAYDGGRYAEAVRIWQKLATAGNVDALTALAGLYISAPPGVPYAPVDAARLYRQAAMRGDPVAQMNLGDFYVSGTGVDRDLGQAAFWLKRAAEQGYQWARERLSEITPEMSAGDRGRMAELEAAWRGKN